MHDRATYCRSRGRIDVGQRSGDGFGEPNADIFKFPDNASWMGHEFPLRAGLDNRTIAEPAPGSSSGRRGGGE